MHRRFTGDRLVIASHNEGKIAEIAALLAPLAIETVSAASLGIPEPEETGDSFEANAALKARAATEASGLPAIADDSGLVVPALGGAPGIYSSRWAGAADGFRSLSPAAAPDRCCAPTGGASASIRASAHADACQASCILMTNSPRLPVPRS